MKITRQALRVNAMLVSLRGQHGVDVIDAICTLLIPLLDFWRGAPITPSLLSKGIRITYGWNITESVASTFIARLERDGQLTRKGDGHAPALISTPLPPNDEADERSISKSFDEVMDLFEDFPLVRDDLINRSIGREALSEKLVRYLISLDAYSEDELAAQFRSQKSKRGETYVDDLAVQDTGLSGGDVYLCARFVTWLAEERRDLVSSLSAIVGAGLLAELIEDFRKPEAVAASSNTTIFFDAPVALSLLGASGHAAQEEARAIYDSLSSIGCRVQVLSESCGEAERVLAAFLRNKPTERHGVTQRAVLKKEVDIDYIRVLQSNFEGALKTFGVNVRHVSLDQFPSLHQYFDAARIEDMISRLGWQFLEAREHDANAVAVVMRLRQGRHSADPLTTSYIFASSNSRLVERARSYCIDNNLVRANEYGPAIDLRDLATVAWLRTGFGESDKLPVSHLLAQSEKVLRVRKDVVDRARRQVERYSPEKSEQFELLLQDNRAVTHITDKAILTDWDDDADQSQALLVDRS